MALDPVAIQILWNRLVSVVDEAATGLIRTAYTPSVKDYHDFCCALFDREARMLAHSTVTTAGFMGIVPEVMRNFIEKFPPETLKPGDVIITNDPWMASGHLMDISIAAPIFYRQKLVGYTLCIVHHLDMGGRMSTLESKDMYEEGLKIPILKLYEGGQINAQIYEFIRANIRVSEKVLGDVRAQQVANHVCTQGLLRCLEEFGMDDLTELSAEIISRTESSMRQEIAKLPDGTYRNQVTLPPIPGCPDIIQIKVAVTIEGDGILIDYTGSSGEVGAAVNCTMTMTRSYSTYPIKLALDPTVPNNEGGLRPITVVAPEGSVLNCRPPAATWGRTMIAHLYPEIIFATLESVLSESLLASNGGSPANEVYLHGRDKQGRTFLAIEQHAGGYGASSRYDGYSTLCFPNNTANIPVEVAENEATIVHLKKEMVVDSDGPGAQRGGWARRWSSAFSMATSAPTDSWRVRSAFRGAAKKARFRSSVGSAAGTGGGVGLRLMMSRSTTASTGVSSRATRSDLLLVGEVVTAIPLSGPRKRWRRTRVRVTFPSRAPRRIMASGSIRPPLRWMSSPLRPCDQGKAPPRTPGIDFPDFFQYATRKNRACALFGERPKRCIRTRRRSNPWDARTCWCCPASSG